MAYQRKMRAGKLAATVPSSSIAYMSNLIKAVIDNDASKLTVPQIRLIAAEVSNDITSTQAQACKDYVIQRLSLENL